MIHTFVLTADPDIYFDEVRRVWDHFLATYLAGLIPLAVSRGAFLVVLRRSWGDECGRFSPVQWCSSAPWFCSYPSRTPSGTAPNRRPLRSCARRRYRMRTGTLTASAGPSMRENDGHQPERWQVHVGLVQRHLGRRVQPRLRLPGVEVGRWIHPARRGRLPPRHRDEPRRMECARS